MQIKNVREAAFLAIWNSQKSNIFVSDFLDKWKSESVPSIQDFNLAKEIAYGATRMALSLDYLASALAEKQKLNLKLKERLLLRTAIYQFFYMDRLPAYAITNETIQIAKKYCHVTFVYFLNAVLRKMSQKMPQLPQGTSIPELSIRYSYPEFFISHLIQDYGLEQAVAIMNCGNKPAPLMFRLRFPDREPLKEMERLEGGLPMAILKNKLLLPEIIKNSDFYVQNATPATLIEIFSEGKSSPKNIIDLCASPGGKIIALHDKFPHASLFVNDISSEKIKTLRENLEKYQIKASVTCCRGENYVSDQLFDLIVLDVPCSNSGVLNKRPEARWRLTKELLEELASLQIQLIEKAVSLLSEEGEIWFMTCSILECENSALIEKASLAYGLKVKAKKTFLPNEQGWDGGFGCVLEKN